MGKTIADLLVVLFFILVNAFFSGTEMAVITLNDAKIQKMSEDGDKRARKVLKFIENPGTFLATIQVGVTFAGFLSSAFAANNFATRLAAAVDPNGVHSWVEALCTVVITLILSYFSLVLGELVPKRIAQKYPEKWAFTATGIVSGFGFITRPFVWFLNISTNGILKVFGINPDDVDKEVTEEEIRMMVDVGSESGSIEDSEKEMIENIFEFNDKEVSAIMTHRKKIIGLPINATYAEVMNLATSEKYSRIPVYENTIDDIVGILHIKDLLSVESPEKFSLKAVLRDPAYVHETMKISKLFSKMKTSGTQMAVILDEYGGTMGICTVEDILEEIVGNISDEFDTDEQECIRLSNGDYIVEGDMTLSDLENVLDIEFEDEEYDTIAGLVLQLLDRVPEEGEKPSVKFKNLKIRVLRVEDRRIAKVMIHVEPIVKEEDSEEDGKSND